MKKLINMFGFLSIVLVLSAAASAQTSYGSEVLIPFDFKVGDRFYQAGKYAIKLGGIKNGAASISVDDLTNDSVQIVLARRNGDPSIEDVNLVFDDVNGVRTLSRIVTPVGGYALRIERNRSRAVARSKKAGSAAEALE